MTSQKLLRWTMVWLICIEIGLALAYLAMIFKQGDALPILDLNGLRSLPSLLQATHLFTIGFLCLLLLIFRHRMPHPISWFLPLALALLCFYGGLDEIAKLHLYLDQYDWKVIYIGILIAIPVLSWQDLKQIWNNHRSTVLWVLAGLGIFLLGGFGAEMLKTTIATELSSPHSPKLFFIAEHLRITVEEFAELLGETLILYAFAQFTQKTLMRAPETLD
ncbi:MAG: hypothetical protein F6K42_09435 [Leptolyngbya sp. SIO1D8]|nr:hypothetical protein [Leptolyngbya sp. SIO1D8]